MRPILWNNGSSETCICIRGHFEEYFYDSEGLLTETVDMVPGGVVLNIEKEEEGAVSLEAKGVSIMPGFGLALLYWIWEIH